MRTRTRPASSSAPATGRASGTGQGSTKRPSVRTAVMLAILTAVMLLFPRRAQAPRTGDAARGKDGSRRDGSRAP